MDATILEPPLPVLAPSRASNAQASSVPIETPFTDVTCENDNTDAGGRRVSVASAVTVQSNRKRAVYRDTPSVLDATGSKSRLSTTTPSGLVTEVNLTRHKRDSVTSVATTVKSKTNTQKSSSSLHRPLAVDIESADLETVLGEDESLAVRLASLQDVDTLSRHIYLRKCTELGVVPISIVVRRIGEAELSIRNRQCGPAGARAIAVPLVYNKSIVTLDLSCNNIRDEGIQPICECLANNVSLRDLRLSENHLTKYGLREIGRLVLNNKHITDLDISGNQFGDASAKILQKIVKETRTLRFLDLSNNNLGIETGVHLGKAIGTNESLEELRLCWNHIRLYGAEALVKGLKDNVRLRRLDLSWNGFGQESAESLAACLAGNEGLVDLDLAGNRLNDEAMVMISKGLKNNTILEKLVLVKNPITNVGAFALLAAIKENESSALQLVDIQDVSVRDDFLSLLSDLQETRVTKVLYNAHALRAHIASPMDVLVTFLMEKGLDIDGTFNLIAAGDQDEAPVYVDKPQFIAQLQKTEVPLTHSQLLELANSLLDEDLGLLNLRGVIEMATDLQAETVSAATSGTPDELSSIMEGGSTSPYDAEVEQSLAAPPSRKPARRERTPIQAGQQYSW